MFKKLTGLYNFIKIEENVKETHCTEQLVSSLKTNFFQQNFNHACKSHYNPLHTSKHIHSSPNTEQQNKIVSTVTAQKDIYVLLDI